MDAKTTGIVAYITWIGLVIAFVLGDREGAKFHLNQALVIWLAGLLSFIPCIGWLWGIFCFICAVMGFISAVNGEEKAVPLLGQTGRPIRPPGSPWRFWCCYICYGALRWGHPLSAAAGSGSTGMSTARAAEGHGR